MAQITFPSNPMPGDIWVEPRLGTTFGFTGSIWIQVQPPNPRRGRKLAAQIEDENEHRAILRELVRKAAGWCFMITLLLTCVLSLIFHWR